MDGQTADTVSSTLADQLSKGHTLLVGDFSRLDYISSAGLRALVVALKLARSNGGDLRIASVRANVRKVLELAGLTDIVKMYDNTPGAVASYGA